MRKSNKIVLVAVAILIAVTIPIYFYVRETSGVEGSIQVKGAVSAPQNFTYGQIENLPQTTVQVKISSDYRWWENGTFNYTGVPLITLLEQAQISPNATSVLIQAPDGFAVTLSIQEVNKTNVILAYQKDGQQLSPFSKGGMGEGPIRLVIGDDHFTSRWVKDVSVIEVQ